MVEARSANATDVKEPSSNEAAVETPRSSSVDVSDKLSHEASETRQASSTEISRALSPVTQSETAGSQPFAVGMDANGVNGYSIEFANGNKVDYDKNLPTELTSPDGSKTRFQWEGGKLSSIALPDGSTWTFQDGQWHHKDASGNADGIADGLRFVNGNGTASLTGPITETTLKRLHDGHLAPPELKIEQTSTPVEAKTAPTMTLETLTTAVRFLRNSMHDSQKVEMILRAIPEQNKQQFEQLYRDTSNGDLRRDLRRRRMDGAIALLEPREEVRQASWLQSNLSSLSRLTPGSTERALIEHNIRLNLRGMGDRDRQSLNDELQQKTGKNLVQTLAESPMTAPSREIATIYATNGNRLSPEQLLKVADIALKSKVSDEQKLLIVKETFSGDSDAARQARQQFMGADGQGEDRLRQVFTSKAQFEQARDYSRTGKLDTATFIELQRSMLADNDKGIELVLHTMTPQQREMFSTGQKLALEGKTEGAAPTETEALQYFQRVHKSLNLAADRLTSPSRWSASNRNRIVTKWEDIAVHGEPTLLGRLTGAEGRLAVIDAIKNHTDRDRTLMSDPSYRKQVWDIVGGPPGTKESKAYAATRLSGIETEAGREELAKVFPEDLPTEAAAFTRRATLAEASENAVRFDGREPFVPRGSAHVFEALMHAKPEDYAALSSEQRRMLNARVELVPGGAREIAKQMLTRLQSGQDLEVGLSEQVVLSGLQNKSRQSIAESIVKQPESARQDPRLEQAARFAFGEDFDKYGKSVLEGRGINAEQLFEMNVQKGLFYNGFDHNNYYNGLKLIPREQREQILSAADRSKEPEAKKYLDKTFGNLSTEQREVALNVLRNPNAEFTLADQIRAKSLNANIDQQQLIDNFARMTPSDRLDLINDYASRYKRFLVNDFAKNGDENQRRQIDLVLPMPGGDLERAFRDSVLNNSQGLYGNTALTEISIAQAQNQFQTQLIDQLPPEKREQAKQEIEQAFQKYVKSLRENSEAKDQFARDLSEKIMIAVTMAGGALPVGTTFARLALTSATAVVARGSSENLIKGRLTSDDVKYAAMFGAVDGLTLARATAFRGIFEKALTNTLASNGSADVAQNVLRTMTKDVDNYFRIGERGRLEFEAELLKALEKRGVKNSEELTRKITNDLRSESILLRVQAGGSADVVKPFIEITSNKNLQKAVDQGLLTPDQMASINKMMTPKVLKFAEHPHLRASTLEDMRRISDNVRFITESKNPAHARAFADVFLLSEANEAAHIPVQALRGAEPRMLEFYRNQMDGALRNLRTPDASTRAGDRYEFAMQREIMEAISASNNPKMREWVFIPGVKGSIPDHAGLDGALINIKDGRILPIDLKSYDNGNPKHWAGIPWTTHIHGRAPAMNFNNRNLYDPKTGMIIEGSRPEPQQIETHLLRFITEQDNRIIKPGTFAELNPGSNVHFPSLSDVPEPGDIAGLRAQADRMRQFIAEVDKRPTGDNPNLALLRQRLQSPQNGRGGLHFLEDEIKKLDVTRATGTVSDTAGTLARLRSVDPTVTEVEAAKIGGLRELISKTTAQEPLSDRFLIATQRSFDRLRVQPQAADVPAIFAATTPADIEKVVANRVAQNLSDTVKTLSKSGKSEDVHLANWSELFLNRESGQVDLGMLSEIARDTAENRHLREVLERMYKGFAPKQRQELIERAVDRLASLL